MIKTVSVDQRIIAGIDGNLFRAMTRCIGAIGDLSDSPISVERALDELYDLQESIEKLSKLIRTVFPEPPLIDPPF